MKRLLSALLGTLLIWPPPAAAEPAQPIVVLVHGAWADTSSWSGQVQALQQQGVST